MDVARVEAARQRLYLQRVVNPALADSAEYPKRWRNLMLIFLSALVAYGTTVLVLAGLREHRQ
jgi:capsular polysaccharide transport system permease protein